MAILSVGARWGHGDDGVRACLLSSPPEQAHLRQRDARATEDYRKAPVHRFQDGIQVAHALFLAQEKKFSNHDRPDDTVLSTAAAKIGRRLQVRVRIS
jgi:hypothetical protein